MAGFRSGPSGQVHYPADVALQVEDHDSERAPQGSFCDLLRNAALTPLESSYARMFRDDTAEPTTNAAELELEDHSDVLQAPNLYIPNKGANLNLAAVLHRGTSSSTAQEHESFYAPLKQRRVKTNLHRR